MFSPHVRILGLLIGLTQIENTGCATSNTCCLNARVFWAREAHWRLHLLRDDLFKACFGSDHASAVLLAAFPSNRTPVVAATACLVTFLFDTAAALGRPPPWRMKLQCVSLAAAFLLSVSSAAFMRLPPSEPMLASLRLPACSSVRSWLLCLRSGSLSAPAQLLAPIPVLHMSAPVRRGAVANARLGLASCPIYYCFCFSPTPLTTAETHGSAFPEAPSS